MIICAQLHIFIFQNCHIEKTRHLRSNQLKICPLSNPGRKVPPGKIQEASMGLVEMLVLCSFIGWASFGGLMKMAVVPFSWEQVSLGRKEVLTVFLCLEELEFCLVCVKALKACLYSLTYLCYMFTARPYSLGLCYFTISLLELLICRYIIDGPGDLAFLHPILVLFSTPCSKMLGMWTRALLHTI